MLALVLTETVLNFAMHRAIRLTVFVAGSLAVRFTIASSEHVATLWISTAESSCTSLITLICPEELIMFEDFFHPCIFLLLRVQLFLLLPSLLRKEVKISLRV